MNDINFEAIRVTEDQLPTLASSGMKVYLSIKVWGNRKQDKNARQKLASDNGADVKSINITKRLIPSKTYEEIVSLSGEARQGYHYLETMPLSDDGWRYILTETMFEYTPKIEEYQNKFYKLVDDFRTEYEYAKTNARFSLGTMYDEDDYPPVEEVLRKFSFTVEYDYVDSTGVAAVQQKLNDNLLQRVNESVNRQQREKTGKYIEKLYTDTFIHVKHLVETIQKREDTERDGGRKGKVSESALQNVRDLVNNLGRFNIMQDENLDRARRDIIDAIDGVTVDALRDNQTCRIETKRKLDSILSSMDW